MIPEQFDTNQFYYRPLPPDRLASLGQEFYKNLDLFKKDFSSLLAQYQGEIRVNRVMLYRIFERIDQRRDYYRYFHSTAEHPMVMSQTKETALFSYWMLKYKPLSFENIATDERFFCDNSYTLNELYVAHLLTTFITGVDEVSKNDADKKFIYNKKTLFELIYSLINRDLSKEALILYVESFRPS